jgi:hypothetical protein
MSSHIHLLCKATNGFVLSDVMQGFQETYSGIIETIRSHREKRMDAEYFSKACEHVKKEQKYKVWQNGYHEHIVINSYVKKDYIHNNPVKDRIVTLQKIIITVLRKLC